MSEVITTGADTRISELSGEFSRIRGAVAYWCFPHQRLSGAFLRGISEPGGYLCCDFHLPTSISVLAALKQAGANVYLHLYALVGRTEVPDSKGVPDNLMHSKVLVFESEGKDECAIWIGSHNGTARALLGLNFECASVIRCSRSSQTYASVIRHLEDIRARSTAFDLRDVDYYRSLQQQPEGIVACIEVYTESGAIPADGEEISLFGVNGEDYTHLRNVDRDGVLSVTDRRTGVEQLFSVQITQSGRLDPKRPMALALSARRIAFHESALPELRLSGPVPPDVYRKAVFFVTLRVASLLADKVAVELPPRDQWVTVPLSSFMSAEPQKAPTATRGRDWPSGRAVTVQRARSRSDADAPVFQRELEVSMKALPLQERAALPRFSMVRKRLLRSKSELE
ncbi:hypothetical protein PE066_04460 [Ramlibacter tataouinensis]|uniref:hypothetical protein n=1 Tax=Ramlibacter tataouinensis TaxID=94132 RepID=UPI0022F3F798|nr:hypothetical protein [Ramlibacter tataouinensis]WBY02798.1 hypothetical protein PE066_04460 [Ramlibacter tataouinensis]